MWEGPGKEGVWPGGGLGRWNGEGEVAGKIKQIAGRYEDLLWLSFVYLEDIIGHLYKYATKIDWLIGSASFHVLKPCLWTRNSALPRP